MTKRQDDPAEQLLDLLVFAPIGLLLEARDLLPRLAEKGREQLGGQVTVARMVGELAVRQGQRQADKFVDRLRQSQARPADEGTRSGAAPSPAPEKGEGGAAPRPSRPSKPAPATPGSSALAIPGYDTLSASQVLPRLEGLSPEELVAVRGYEEATRSRKTILSRIDQLRARQ